MATLVRHLPSRLPLHRLFDDVALSLPHHPPRHQLRHQSPPWWIAAAPMPPGTTPCRESAPLSLCTDPPRAPRYHVRGGVLFCRGLLGCDVRIESRARLPTTTLQKDAFHPVASAGRRSHLGMLGAVPSVVSAGRRAACEWAGSCSYSLRPRWQIPPTQTQ